MNNILQHITGEKGQKLLAEHGMVVSVRDANVIVDYLYSLTKLLFSHEESNIIHKS